ncbi:large ribosomal subunit protein mL39 isoform X10 [Chlorocebus sabaeus]|uniref:large ribosomal subunit protein mL39 isoform X10 n=1 Tax=Chlorocebus sabaeus TaxID=60711 RepID=UPI003BF95180
MEALAMGVRVLRLWRVASGGGISWRFIATSPASQLSPTELTEMRNDLFNKEKARQLSLTPRTEKIEVKHVGKTDPGTVFVMNKNISTPYSCAMHLSEWYCRKSILALVDGQPWDMYKPLTKSCEIKFLTFKDRDPGEVNKAYWRSCAMMMGCVIERAFKDEYMVNLVRAPEVPVISGAFCYDVVLDSKLDEWMPTKENLRSFTKDAHALIYKDLPFETLEVEAKVALEIFQHNKYKIDFIEEKASQNPERIVKLHRFSSQSPILYFSSRCRHPQKSETVLGWMEEQMCGRRRGIPEQNTCTNSCHTLRDKVPHIYLEIFGMLNGEKQGEKNLNPAQEKVSKKRSSPIPKLAVIFRN